MSERLYAIFFVAVFALCLCACAPHVGGLKFEAPDGWNGDEDSRENFAMYSPPADDGSIMLSFNNTVESDLSDDNIAKMREELIETAAGRGKAEITEEGKVDAGGHLWLKISFYYPESGAHWFYYMTRFDRKQYFILLVCRDSAYETYRPVLEKVVNSVKFAD